MMNISLKNELCHNQHRFEAHQQLVSTKMSMPFDLVNFGEHILVSIGSVLNRNTWHCFGKGSPFYLCGRFYKTEESVALHLHFRYTKHIFFGCL